MTAADFLVELGTEELPPKALLTLRDAFTAGILQGLTEANLQHGEVQGFATPRRLAVCVKELTSQQAAQEIENRGPPVRLAFDDNGNPTKAAEAFAAKCGVRVNQLSRTETDKGEWLYYKGRSEGVAAAELIPAIVDKALAALPIPKRMRWGASDTEFVRPAHWLVMMHGDTVIPATVLGLKAGNQTFGHRFHSPGAITVTAPAHYADILEQQGKVIADFAARRARVVTAAHQAAAELGGEALLHDEVVDEVTALVEWPVPVAGRFDETFLRLPREVLISTLQDHQRYFPVIDGEHELKAAFITISNIESTQPAEVRRGNERVVLPRLADAAFFWDQDGRSKLADRIDALDSVVYQQGLGSLRDKSARVAKLAAALTGISNADPANVARAALLSRTDLLTDMVGEFPELQGRMGYYYASNDGEDEQVAIALEEQYLPRHAGDRLPQTAVGRTLAVADRLDTLAGVFALGKKPTGNKDPFGLRRQALGLIRIIVEGGLDADLPDLLDLAAQLQPEQTNKQAPAQSDVARTVHDFVMDRLRAWYLDGHAPGFSKGDVSPEMFAAVLARNPRSLLDFHARINAVRNFMQHDSAVSLAAANKRIANILRKADDSVGTKTSAVDTGLFESNVEQQLYEAIEGLRAEHGRDLESRNYEGLLIRLAGLREPVDNYFDDVMVMTDDDRQRNNRLAQLSALRTLFLDVADISQL